MNQCVMGVQLLYFVVMEINQSENTRPLTRHRKIASSFRDNTLFDIFQLACNLLTQVTSGQKINENTIEVCKMESIIFLLYSLALIHSWGEGRVGGPPGKNMDGVGGRNMPQRTKEM